MNKKEKNKNEISTKNYIVVCIMFVTVFLAVIGIAKWYENYKKYNLSIPVISGKINEISFNDFDNYLSEHENFYLYICTSSNKNCRSIEKNIVNLLEKKEIINDTIYINADKYNKKEVFSKFDRENGDYPLFIIYKNGLVYGVSSKTGKSYSINDLSIFLDESGVEK